MPTLTITAKGQVTLRKEVLKHLGVGPGDKIDFDLGPKGKASVSVHARPTGSIENFFGMLASPDGPVLTIEEIKRATEEAWASAMDFAKSDKP